MEYNIVLPSPIKVVSEEENKGSYDVDGLYPGYGHTFGNSIRRIMLSSLPGAAVTRVKIEGASHEFSTLPGVLEDAITMLLNFKQLRFKLHGEGPEVAVIDAKGAKEVKGKDIKCPTQLEVSNRDQHIATLTDKNAHFSVELTVEKGLGFVPSEELMKDKVPVGTIVLDAIFTPVRRVNYEVENMRVGDRTDFNRLHLFIETDGTISPRDALRGALHIMKAQIEAIESFEEGDASRPRSKSDDHKVAVDLGSAFDELKFSTRTKNALIAAGISTPGALAEKTVEELLQTEGVGAKAISEIKKGLSKLELSLKE